MYSSESTRMTSCKRNPVPLAPPLEAVVSAMAQQLGCLPSEARAALQELMRVGLVTVRGSRIVLPLAEKMDDEEQGAPDVL